MKFNWDIGVPMGMKGLRLWSFISQKLVYCSNSNILFLLQYVVSKSWSTYNKKIDTI